MITATASLVITVAPFASRGGCAPFGFTEYEGGGHLQVARHGGR